MYSVLLKMGREALFYTHLDVGGGENNMDPTYITREEHEAFSKLMESENERLKEEDNRQNHRLDVLEKSVQQISKLAASTEKLAVNMENMLRVQEQQGKRLETLESRDGEKWRQITGYAINTLISLVIGYFFAKLQLGL